MIFITEVASVTANGPAFLAGLQIGDFLVKFEDELVLFMSHQDIEDKLKHDYCKGLTLNLEVERGQVEPMQVNNDGLDKPVHREEDVFTIVLDKNKGIYHI